jgi:glutamyl-tRNA synthetase
VAVLGEVPELVEFLFTEAAPVDEDSWQKAVVKDETAPSILAAALEAYATCEWTVGELHRVTLGIAESMEKKLGKAQAPIRVAVMGTSKGLPLFDSLEVLGRDETRRRIRAALDRIARAA